MCSFIKYDSFQNEHDKIVYTQKYRQIKKLFLVICRDIRVLTGCGAFVKLQNR